MKTNKTINKVLSRINGIILENTLNEDTELSWDDFENKRLKFDNGYQYFRVNGVLDKNDIFWFDKQELDNILRQTKATKDGSGRRSNGNTYIGYRASGEYMEINKMTKKIDGTTETLYSIDRWSWGD